MRFIKTKIKDLIILEPEIFGDNRGYFIESYNQKYLSSNIKLKVSLQDTDMALTYKLPPYFTIDTIFKHNLL